ncbi:MAG TPA: DUF1566 domain-containing protein, partial [Leptospiraceae bacterium]|nr:DUF1566 domain-containing protein [Leptospiraceae bacterium]
MKNTIKFALIICSLGFLADCASKKKGFLSQAIPLALLGTNTGGNKNIPAKIDAPSEFSYSLSGDNSNGQINTNIAETDQPVNFTPSISGTKPITFSISPALPKGLVIDSETGVISGTPEIWSLSTEYTITAQNPSGTVSVKITFSTTTPGRVTGTGINKCYSWSVNQEIPCGDSTYPNQDADFQTPRSFTGPTPHTVYTDDYTTRDNVKGLVWKSCLEGQSGSDCSGGNGPYIFTRESAVAACNNLNTANAGNGYAGMQTWRVPTIQELYTIFDNSVYYGVPKSSPAYFPGNDGYTKFYISSSIFNESRLWIFSDTTKQEHSYPVLSMFVLRCVSGQSLPIPSFRDNQDGTVGDHTSKLLWQKCPAGLSGSNCESGSLNRFSWWFDSLQYCKNLNFAGKTWRLPNINELVTIKDYSKSDLPLINNSFFPNTPYTPTTPQLQGPYFTFLTSTVNSGCGPFLTFGDSEAYFCTPDGNFGNYGYGG